MKKKFFTQRNPEDAKHFCFLFSIIFLLFFVHNAKADYWTQKANFPNAGVRYPFTFSIGDKGYVGTGDGTGGVVNDFWEYDPSMDVWTQKADFGGIARFVACGFSVGNKGYAGTGYPGLNDFWEYDAAANTWTQKANFGGSARYGAVGFTIGSFGYIATGGTGPYTNNDLWQYNPSTDTWIQKTNLPGPAREEANCFVIGDNGYVVGGTMDGSTANVLSDLWEYNSITDSWTQKANCPGVARCDAAAFSVCNKGYFGSGDPCHCTEFWQYDPVINTWTQKADFGGTGRDEMAFLSIGNKGYFGLGSDQGLYNDFWEYTPDDVCNAVMLNFSASDTTLCEKFCINYFDSSANNPTAWQWIFPGGDPSSSTLQNPTNICYDLPGTYDVTLITTSANGTDTLTLTNYITVFPTPPFPTITQAGYTLTSSAANSYQWQFNSYDIPGATNQSYDVMQTGYYTVVVGDSNSCKNSTTVYVLISGIDEVKDGNIFINPNPSSGNFTVELLLSESLAEVSIDVVNTLGQKVFTSSEKIYSPDFKMKVDLGNIARGVYFVEVKAKNEFVRKKIVIIK